jgi:hypothetical protein
LTAPSRRFPRNVFREVFRPWLIAATEAIVDFFSA